MWNNRSMFVSTNEWRRGKYMYSLLKERYIIRYCSYFNQKYVINS